MAKRSNRMERRDNYDKALREEEEALGASMGKSRGTGENLGDATRVPVANLATHKQTPIAPRWAAHAKREADRKKKTQ
ncbi:MAG: hypothetical protein ABSG70_17865 [Terriglobales bacterium]